MNLPILQFGQRCLRGTRTFWRAGVDFVYPRACPLCGREDREITESFGAGPKLCAECRLRLAPEILHSCRRCSAPVGPHLDTVNGCVHCRNDRFAFETVIRLGVYEGLLKRASQRAKCPGGQPLAAALGGLLWQCERESFHRVDADWVVPIPHHWTQRIRRTHSASATLAAVLARRLKVDSSKHILAKVRKTPAQTSLTPSRRRTNLRGAFRVRGASVLAGATVLLVDDILTTGTTAHEAAKVLKRAGAQRVVAAVLARGLGQT